jgi:hypothetical protein
MFDILGAIGFVILVIANVIISRDIRELTTEVTIAVGVDRLPREV